MEKEKIDLSDLSRILIGEVPGLFYIELIFRAVVCYIVIVVSMRMMGSRISSQLSRNELAAVAALAASMGIPLLDPSRGLLPAIVSAGVVVAMQKIIGRKGAKNKKFESLTQGNISTLVMDGAMQLQQMHSNRITRERVLAQIRNEGLEHLGQVKRLFMEANGSFTLIKEADPKPGLTAVPEWDTKFIARQKKNTGIKVCCFCGYSAKAETGECEQCGASKFTPAVEL